MGRFMHGKRQKETGSVGCAKGETSSLKRFTGTSLEVLTSISGYFRPKRSVITLRTPIVIRQSCTTVRSGRWRRKVAQELLQTVLIHERLYGASFPKLMAVWRYSTHMRPGVHQQVVSLTLLGVRSTKSSKSFQA